MPCSVFTLLLEDSQTLLKYVPTIFHCSGSKKCTERPEFRWKALSLRGAQWLPPCNRMQLTCVQVLALEMSSWAGRLLHFPLAFSLKIAYSVFLHSEWHFVTTCVIWVLFLIWLTLRPLQAPHILKPMGNLVSLGHPSEAQGSLASSEGNLGAKWH